MSYIILGPDGTPYNKPTQQEGLVDSGKTKLVYPHAPGIVAVTHKGVITAFDNPAFTGISSNKGIASAYSSALLFKEIEARGVPTSHVGFLNANTTLEKHLEMLPFEMIWRRFNVEGNSYEKRNPWKFEKGIKYPKVIYEACMKWSVITHDGETIHDPFLLLDDNFEPILNAQGLPRLIHPKLANTEIDYQAFIHPNKKVPVEATEVQKAIEQFRKYAQKMREYMEVIQQTTFDTYASIGRLNADGKVEFGINPVSGELILGDELELDALRNMSPQKIDINGDTFTFEEDTLGRDLFKTENPSTNQLLAIGQVNKIITARHSGKQVYRDIVNQWTHLKWDERKTFNNQAAEAVTEQVYIPTALALSWRFRREVGYALEHRDAVQS